MKLALLLATAVVSPLAGCATEEEALPPVDSSAFAAGTWDRQSGGVTFERLELFADKTFAYTHVYPDNDYDALYGTWNAYARELILSEIVDRSGTSRTSQRFSYYANDVALVRGAYHYDETRNIWTGWDTLATPRSDLIIVEPSFTAVWVPMYSDEEEVFAGGAYSDATNISLDRILFEFFADRRVLGRREESRSTAGLVDHPLELAVIYDRVN